ncbi:MAG: aldo/keto reductase, partial [Stackebrandtia sp.]
LGLGTAPLAGMYAPVTEPAAVTTVARGWELGLRYFDTAPHYGAGLAETRLGAAIQRLPAERYTISTKVGRLLVPGEPAEAFWTEPNGLTSHFDFSATATEKSLSDSRRRLGDARVAIGLIHDPDDHYQQALSGSYPVLRQWRRNGELGAIGVGMTQSAMLTRFAAAGDFDVFMIAGRYNLLDTSALNDLLPWCAARGNSVVAAGVYHGGLLADPDHVSPLNYLSYSAADIAKLAAIAAVCARYGVPLRAAAVQFPAAHPAVASVIVGVRSAAEVDDAVTMYECDIPGQLWTELKSAGLIPRQAPTP